MCKLCVLYINIIYLRVQSPQILYVLTSYTGPSKSCIFTTSFQIFLLKKISQPTKRKNPRHGMCNPRHGMCDTWQNVKLMINMPFLKLCEISVSQVHFHCSHWYQVFQHGFVGQVICLHSASHNNRFAIA